MNRTVAPGDDFYEYANGTWAKTTPIPADKSNYGMFTVLEDLSKKRTQEILEAAEKDPNSKIGNAFASYLDEATVEAKGLTPIKPWLEEIRSEEHTSELQSLMRISNDVFCSKKKNIK